MFNRILLYAIVIAFGVLVLELRAEAKECFISIEGETLFVDKRIGPSPYKRICQVTCDEGQAADYDIEIITSVGEEVTDVKPWTPNASLELGQSIRCRLSPVKVVTRKNVEKAKVDAEKAKKDKDISDWGKACADTKDPVAIILCKERGF